MVKRSKDKRKQVQRKNDMNCVKGSDNKEKGKNSRGITATVINNDNDMCDTKVKCPTMKSIVVVPTKKQLKKNIIARRN